MCYFKARVINLSQFDNTFMATTLNVLYSIDKYVLFLAVIMHKLMSGCFASNNYVRLWFMI